MSKFIYSSILLVKKGLRQRHEIQLFDRMRFAKGIKSIKARVLIVCNRRHLG